MGEDITGLPIGSCLTYLAAVIVPPTADEPTTEPPVVVDVDVATVAVVDTAPPAMVAVLSQERN